MIIKSINDNTDLSNEFRYYFLSNLCECTPSNVSRLAEMLMKENMGDTLVIVTETIYYHGRCKITDPINQDYKRMQSCVENGAQVCSVLGIDFHVQEEKQAERKFSLSRARRGSFSAVYTITLSGINSDQLLSRAEAYNIHCEDRHVEQIRRSCSSFYQRISASPVVESVASVFLKKIIEIAGKRFINSFHIFVRSHGISLGGMEENYVSFSFEENGLTNLPDVNQRLGFCLAVIDEIASQLKLTPVLGRKAGFIGEMTITNQMHLVSHSSEEFELIFMKDAHFGATGVWY